MRAPFWSRRTFRYVVSFAFALAAGASHTALFAANAEPPRSPADRQAAAKALLAEALACEVDGRSEERAALLAKAEALAPDLPAIQWHRGMIFEDGKWTPAEDVAIASEDRALVEEYVAKRDASENSLAGQFALSKWCQEEKLFAQERAHLVRVLTFDPNHELARVRLGFVRIGDEWVSRAEIARAIADEAKAQASIKKHAGALHDIVRWLNDDNPAVRERAFERVRAVRDPEMIPALETLVAPVSEDAALAVVVAISELTDKRGSLSLARFAVLSPSHKVRRAASELLKARPFDHFVQEMLLSMKGPSRTAELVLRDGAGRLVYRRLSYREGMSHADLAVRDSIYRGTSVVDLGLQPVRFVVTPAGFAEANLRVNMAPEQARALDDLALRSVSADAAAKVEEADRLDLNARIGQALEKITNQRLGTNAEPWWDWWIQYDETTAASQKPIRTQYASQIVDVPTSAEYKASVGELELQVCSCFAAGTSVLTNRGDVPIEQVRVGDLVLSQDAETGQLAFKPVLDTTVGPAAEILRVVHEGGSLRCTGGHPFWVSGEGWVNARRLKSGMELHTAQGSVAVSEIASDGTEPAYNLIVADFSTYFVGEERILCHDITSRMATDAVVPGLLQD